MDAMEDVRFWPKADLDACTAFVCF